MLLAGLQGSTRILLQAHLRYQRIARDFEGVGDVFWEAGKNAPNVNTTITREKAITAGRVDEFLRCRRLLRRRVADMRIAEPLGGKPPELGDTAVRPVEVQCVDQDAGIGSVDGIEHFYCPGQIGRLRPGHEFEVHAEPQRLSEIAKSAEVIRGPIKSRIGQLSKHVKSA